MKNKKLLLIVSIVLAMMMSLGGTLAYLTDTDSEVNVMTVGNVIIDLIEQQRNGKTGDELALEDYEQGKPMIPIVGSAQGAKDKFGMPEAANYVDKIVSVKNTGRSDAWVRVLVAVPDSVDNIEDAAGALHWNFGNKVALNGDYDANNIPEWRWDYQTTGGQNITIGTESYNVYCFYYKDKLPAGAQTSAAIAGMYMDSGVDYDADNGYYTFNDVKIEGFTGNVVIPVLAQAVQADGFLTYNEAFNAAFPYNELQSWFNADDMGLVNATPAHGATRPAGHEIALEGEIIDGLTVIDNSDDVTNLRALYREGGIQGDLTILNSVLDGTYAMNPTVQDGFTGKKLVAENTTFMGWVSYSKFETATFTNCTFRLNSEGTYNFLRAYDPTTFTGCEFKGTELDVADNGSITLVDCTYNGELITNKSQLKLADGVDVTISNTK